MAAGWKLKEGNLDSGIIPEDAYWSLFNYLFSEKSRKRNSYKFGLLKSILDCVHLANATTDFSIHYSDIFAHFTQNYWNLVVKYKLRQMRPDGQSEVSAIEQVLFCAIEKHCDNIVVPFDSLSEETRETIINNVLLVCKKYVIGALYQDFSGKLFGFNRFSNILVFNKCAVSFMMKYKHTLEVLNYYYWAKFLETIEYNNNATLLIDKLELATPKRTDLSAYRDILLKKTDAVCFYCGKPLTKDDIHVDHFIPWSFLHDDQLWNFVLSCSKCNIRKSNKIVEAKLSKIIEQNKILLLDKECSDFMKSYSESDYVLLLFFAKVQGCLTVESL